jgi:hypothetical protein
MMLILTLGAWSRLKECAKNSWEFLSICCFNKGKALSRLRHFWSVVRWVVLNYENFAD